MANWQLTLTCRLFRLSCHASTSFLVISISSIRWFRYWPARPFSAILSIQSTCVLLGVDNLKTFPKAHQHKKESHRGLCLILRLQVQRSLFFTGNTTHPFLSIGYFLLGKVLETIPGHSIVNFTPVISYCYAIHSRNGA